MSQNSNDTGLVSPPSGNGNVPGLGESFSVNLNTGQGSYTYKIHLPEGIAGHSPKLTLEYAHGYGLGVFGMGWRMPLRKIWRSIDTGTPDTLMPEKFYESGSEIVETPNGSFMAVSEGLFGRYIKQGNGWKLEERNGIIHYFGINDSGRVAHPEHPEQIFEWLLQRSIDTCGNEINYQYFNDQNTAYLSSIQYAIYEIKFIYEARADARSYGRYGVLQSTGLRCKEIQLVIDEDSIARSWQLHYIMDVVANISLLQQVQVTSFDENGDHSLDVVRRPVTFSYTSFDPANYRASFMTGEDGIQPPPVTDPETVIVTVDNAPLPGVLQSRNGSMYYWPNRGDLKWGVPRKINEGLPVSSFSSEGIAFIDMDGSGTADLISVTGNMFNGYFANTGKNGFLDYKPYPRGNKALPNIFSGNTRLTDTNGNGVIDALMTNTRSMVTWQDRGSEGWSAPQLTSKGALPASLSFDDPFIHLADFTGDGLQDIVSVQSGRVEYFSNIGDGKFSTGIVMMNSPRLQSLSLTPENLFLLDVNDDGCDDLVFVTSTSVLLAINQNGKQFSEPFIIDNIPSPIPGSVRIADMKGNGKKGLLWNSLRAGKTCYVYLEFDAVNGSVLLSEINNGSGLVSKLFYKAATEDYIKDYKEGNIWLTNFSFPLIVVASTLETDVVTGSRVETHYSYHEAHFETNTRQFQGFASADKILKGDESCPDILTVFSFLMAQERNANATRDSIYLNGKMYRTETYALDGSALQDKPYKTEEALYDLQVLHALPDGRNRIFAYVETNTTNYIERSDDTRTEKKMFEYDEWGNIIKETHTGSGIKEGVAQPELSKITEVTYAHGTTTYIHDKPCHFVLRNKDGVILKEKKRYYDGDKYKGLLFGRITKGLLSREEELALSKAGFDAHYQGLDAVALGYVLSTDADGNPAMFIQAERNKHSDRGLKTGTLDKQGTETLYEFDMSGLFKTRLHDPMLGTTKYTYNKHVAQPALIEYSDGNTTTIKYDAQGRTISILLPGDDVSKPPRVYSYDDSAVPHKRVTQYRADKNIDETCTSITYFDGYGKECQHRVEMEPGKFVVSGIELKNPIGKTRREFDPVFATDDAYSLDINDALASRRMYYDALERTVQTVNYNEAVSRAVYKCFEVITYDANDCDNTAENIARGQFDTPKKEEFDVFRNRTKIIEVNGSGGTEETVFNIDENAELLSITDKSGLAVSYKKDMQGNILQLDHRESGTRKLWYNASSKVVRSLDANGNDLQIALDEKNRIQTLTSNGNILEQYFYDDITVNALGKVNSVEYTAGKQEFAYDVSGKLTSRKYQFNGLQDDVVINYGYDYLGREISAAYSNGKTITKNLSSNGWTKSVDGIITNVERNARGLAEKIEYTNGVVTEFTYADGPEMLLSRALKNSNNVILEDVSFAYDKASLLLQKNDVAEAKNYLYSYDPLYQVKQFSVDNGGGNTVYDYTYGDHFNITASGESGLSFLYEDATHGDRITGIQQGVNPATQLLYDANGNLLNLPGKQFSYNEKNELINFEHDNGTTATYAYDHCGKRIYKKVDDGNSGITETFFAGDHVEIRNGQMTIFATLEKKRIAIIDDAGTSFVHTDQSGNTGFFTDDNGTKIAAIAYRPFGNIDSSNGAIDHRTFGHHMYDAESGLYYMQRRYYAPEIGRFITTDPIATYKPEKVIGNPKALHVYAYTGNDPVNNTDADGLSFWSVLGAVVGVIVGVVVAAALAMTGVGIIALIGIALLISVGVSALGYGLASAFNNTPFGEFMRGFMIGFNAGMNAVIGTAIFGPVVGVALGVINFLAAFDDVARNPIYQGILGWSSWLMPMSWGAQAVGAVIFIINILAAAFTGNQVNATKIDSISIDWTTGSIIMVGGLIRNGTAFAPGNFVFVDPAWLATDPNVSLHEIGHVLSTGAFGTGFILIDFIDENIIGNGANAWGEQMADSHDPALAPASAEQMWGT